MVFTPRDAIKISIKSWRVKKEELFCQANPE
jgi:hypothetical protein